MQHSHPHMKLYRSDICFNCDDNKVICGCKCCISVKSIHVLLLSWRDWYLKNSKIKSKMIKTEGLVKNQIAYMTHIEIQ